MQVIEERDLCGSICIERHIQGRGTLLWLQLCYIWWWSRSNMLLWKPSVPWYDGQEITAWPSLGGGWRWRRINTHVAIQIEPSILHLFPSLSFPTCFYKSNSHITLHTYINEQRQHHTFRIRQTYQCWWFRICHSSGSSHAIRHHKEHARWARLDNATTRTRSHGNCSLFYAIAQFKESVENEIPFRDIKWVVAVVVIRVRAAAAN